MNTELIARLWAEAAILATLAGHWGEYVIHSVRRGSKSAGDEAAYAFHRGNRSLDLSAAAEELEKPRETCDTCDFCFTHSGGSMESFCQLLDRPARDMGHRCGRWEATR